MRAFVFQQPRSPIVIVRREERADLQMNQQQAFDTEWRSESVEKETRSTRIVSIEELRKKLGLERTEPTAARTAPAADHGRPRIVWRREGAMRAPELMAE
jgi:hypothetical protein